MLTKKIYLTDLDGVYSESELVCDQSELDCDQSEYELIFLLHNRGLDNVHNKKDNSQKQ